MFWTGFLAFLVLLGSHDVDCSGVERGLDVRRVVFLDHLDASAAVLSDLVDVGTLHQAQADVCMPQTVGRTRSAFAVETKLFFVEDGFEKLALPLGKNEIRGSGRAPLFAKSQRRSRTFLGACSRHKCAPGEAGFEVAQKASLHRAYSCNIRRRAFRELQSPGSSCPNPRRQRS